MRSIAFLLSSCLALAVLTCGGGGGNGPAPAPPGPSLSASPSSFNLTGDLVGGWTANPASFAFQLILNNPPSSKGTYSVAMKHTGNAIDSVDWVGDNVFPVSFSITFKPMQTLGVGTFSDSIVISCMQDSNGVEVAGSPLTIPVAVNIAKEPTPVITCLGPMDLMAGNGSTAISVLGSGFTPDSVVQWGGQQRTTSYISKTLISAVLEASDLATAGTTPVSVSNAAGGGGTSLPADFHVLPAQFSILRLVPSSAGRGCPDVTLQVLGAGFQPGAIVQWNGASRPTNFVSGTLLTAVISAADLRAPGSASVTVLNPGNPGSTTNPLPFAVFPVDAVSAGSNPAHTQSFWFNALSLPSSPRWSLPGWINPKASVTGFGRIFSPGQVGNTWVLLAIDAATGATTWTIQLPGTSGLCLDGNSLYVFSEANSGGTVGLSLQAVDPATGRTIWNTALPSQGFVAGPPVAANGTVYAIGMGSGATLFAVDEAQGKVLWQQQAALAPGSTPAVSPDGVYLAGASQILCLDPSSGKTKWTYSAPITSMTGTPVLANGLLYSASLIDPQILVLNAETGAYQGILPFYRMPLFISQGMIVMLDDTWVCLDRSGSVLWRSGPGFSTGGQAILVNGMLIASIGTAGIPNGFTCLDAGTGTALWTQFVPSETISFTVGGGLLLMEGGLIQGTFTAYSLSAQP